MNNTRQRATSRRSHRLARTVAAVLALALAPALASGTAYAGWERPPTTLSTTNANVSAAPSVVIDGHGTSYAVWVERQSRTSGDSVLVARVRRPGQSWGPTETVASRDGAHLEDVKVAPDGTLGVLWDYTIEDPVEPYNVPLFSTRSADGRWSTTPDGTIIAGALEVDARGDFLLAGGQGVQFRPADTGTWGPFETIPVKNGEIAHVGLDRSGNATFVVLKNIYYDCGFTACPIVTVERRRNGQWTSPRKVTTTFDNRRDSFAESPGGAATIAWRNRSGSVQAVFRPADSTKWGPVRTIGTAADTSNPYTFPLTTPPVVAAMGPRAASTLVWLGTNQKVYAAGHTARDRWQRRTIGTWSSPNYHYHPEYPILLAAPDGSLAAGWWQGNSAMVSTRPAGRGWTTPVRSPMGYLAVGNHAVTTSSWASYENADPSQSQYGATSSYDPGRPKARSTRIPKTGKVGQRLKLAVDLDSWLPATVTWGFGGGHRATGPKVHHTFQGPGKHRVVVTIKDTSGATTTVHRTIRISKRH